MNIEGSFPLGLTGLNSYSPRDSQASCPAYFCRSAPPEIIVSTFLSLSPYSVGHRRCLKGALKCRVGDLAGEETLGMRIPRVSYNSTWDLIASRAISLMNKTCTGHVSNHLSLYLASSWAFYNICVSRGLKLLNNCDFGGFNWADIAVLKTPESDSPW